MTQVVERHILRGFEGVFPKDISDEKIKALTVQDQDSERKRETLSVEKNQVTDLLKALEKYEGMG